MKAEHKYNLWPSNSFPYIYTQQECIYLSLKKLVQESNTILSSWKLETTQISIHWRMNK